MAFLIVGAIVCNQLKKRGWDIPSKADPVYRKNAVADDFDEFASKATAEPDTDRSTAVAGARCVCMCVLVLGFTCACIVCAWRRCPVGSYRPWLLAFCLPVPHHMRERMELTSKPGLASSRSSDSHGNAVHSSGTGPNRSAPLKSSWCAALRTRRATRTSTTRLS